jgi:hypothetical protein
MRIGRGNWSTREETCPSVILFTTNPVWPDLRSNPGRRGGKPDTDRPRFARTWHGESVYHWLQLLKRFLAADLHNLRHTFSTKWTDFDWQTNRLTKKLIVGLEVSFDSTKDWKGVREKAREVNMYQSATNFESELAILCISKTKLRLFVSFYRRPKLLCSVALLWF